MIGGVKSRKKNTTEVLYTYIKVYRYKKSASINRLRLSDRAVVACTTALNDKKESNCVKCLISI